VHSEKKLYISCRSLYNSRVSDTKCYTVPAVRGCVKEDDGDESSASAFICNTAACYDIIIEGSTVLTNLKTFTEALLAIFICHYVLNLEYNKRFKMFYMFVQVWLVGIAESVLPSKLLSFCNKLERARK